MSAQIPISADITDNVTGGNTVIKGAEIPVLKVFLS